MHYISAFIPWDKLIDGKAQQAPGDYITRGLLFHYHEIITQNRKSNEKKSELLKEGWMWKNFYIRQLAAAYRLETFRWKMQ